MEGTALGISQGTALQMVDQHLLCVCMYMCVFGKLTDTLQNKRRSDF
jgi:hypothetical protein